jgi:hypothetical protein
VIGLEFTLKGKVDKQFGVGNLMVKSIRKDKSVSLQPSANNSNQAANLPLPLLENSTTISPSSPFHAQPTTTASPNSTSTGSPSSTATT